MNRMTKYMLLAAIACGTPAAFAAPATLPATTRPAISKGDQLFSDGKDALFRRDFPKAIELLRKAAAEDKTKTSYRVHLARALQYANQGKEAVADARTYLRDTRERIIRLLRVNSPNVKESDQYRLAMYEGGVEKFAAQAEEGSKVAYLALKALVGYNGGQDFRVPQELPATMSLVPMGRV